MMNVQSMLYSARRHSARREPQPSPRAWPRWGSCRVDGREHCGVFLWHLRGKDFGSTISGEFDLASIVNGLTPTLSRSVPPTPL